MTVVRRFPWTAAINHRSIRREGRVGRRGYGHGLPARPQPPSPTRRQPAIVLYSVRLFDHSRRRIASCVRDSVRARVRASVRARVRTCVLACVLKCSRVHTCLLRSIRPRSSVSSSLQFHSTFSYLFGLASGPVYPSIRSSFRPYFRPLFRPSISGSVHPSTSR